MRVNFGMMLLAGCAMLAACSSGDDRSAANQSAAADGGEAPAKADGETMSMEDMAKSAQSMGLKPGAWKVRVEVADIQMKGMPGGQEQAIADAMKKRMGSQEIMSCITPEQAAKPSADILAAQKQANCTYANSAIAGGRIHAEMTCKPQGGAAGTMTAVMDGSYAPDRYSMTVNMDTAGENGMGMTMKSSTTGQWVGPTCKPQG
jgi:hypothetical protein